LLISVNSAFLIKSSSIILIEKVLLPILLIEVPQWYTLVLSKIKYLSWNESLYLIVKLLYWLLYLFISKGVSNDLVLTINVTFTSTQGDQIKGRFKQESEADITLKSLGLSVDKDHTPNFAMISGNNGVKYDGATGEQTQNQGDGTNGVYEYTDDLGTSYYFRGAVQNNYVEFGGTLWRIVRINGNGTIRIALNQSIGTSAFNENYNDNAYVGYMYGTPGSSAYAETHSNTNNSTIKTYLDTWYQANLLQYEDKIADAIYCNDRTIAKFTYIDFDEGEKTFSGNGVGTEVTAYAGYKRTFIDHTPSLVCTNSNDKFTVCSSLGNGVLSHPIGLLTLDEYNMAGSGTLDLISGNVYFYTNDVDAFYLYDANSDEYWSMTPVHNYIDEAYIGTILSSDGSYPFYNTRLFSNDEVRPVVSLKSSSITGGNGTSTDPFVVGGTNDTEICLNGNGC